MTTRWLHGRSPRNLLARYRLGASIVVLVLVFGMFYASPGVAQKGVPAASAGKPTRASPSPSRAIPDAVYVGSEACSRCHAEIYNHFSQTAMGRSMTQVTPEFLRTLPLPAAYYDSDFNRHFEVEERDGKLMQTEYELDNSGKEIFRNTKTIHWIVGADANGLGGLVSQDNYIFEAPLSYFSQTKKWELSPGYQRGDYGFTRVIAPGCIFCHSGRSQPVAQMEGKYQDPAFTQLAIGCENCHGPGSAHVAAMDQGEEFPKGQDPTIVDPATLKPALANDICMSCHQTGDTRFFQPGKTYADFRPGTPLNRVLAILMVPPTRENPPSEDHVEHYYSMILSKCFRASAADPNGKQLRCISCHDPHTQPTGIEAADFYNSRCLDCHTVKSCKAPVAVREETASATTPADNCIGCHMPKRKAGTISHTTLTNHRIIARPGEPFPDAAFEMTTAALPDLIYLNATADQPVPPRITLLQAYAQLQQQHPEYKESYEKLLRDLAASEPENAIVQVELGNQAFAAKQLDAARQHLEEAVRLDPMQPGAYAKLSEIATEQGRTQDAVIEAQKAVALEPYSAQDRKSMILSFINAQRYSEAEDALKKYLEDFPEDDGMRRALAMVTQN